MAKVHVKCDGTKAVYRNYNACCSNATFIQPRLYHFWLQVFSVLRQTLSPTASLIVRVFQTSPVRPYGAGGGGCGGDGDGSGGVLVDAVSNSDYITSNDGIMKNSFKRMLKEAVVASFKTTSKVTG